MEEESSSNDSVMEKSSDVEGAQSVDESLSERGAEVDRISYAQLTVNIDENSGKSVSRFSDSQNAAVSSDMEGNRIPASTFDLVAGAEKDIIYMPLNINGTHW
ncbi:hypothetical protein L917_10778, partial [Phytophthora nicotianae]